MTSTNPKHRSTQPAKDAIVACLLRMIDEAWSGRSWHGPNLRGSIRRVTAEQAAWRPGPARRCIAEIVVHAAYWKYAIRRRLRGDKRGSFPLKGSNWFKIADPLTEQTWRGYTVMLDEQHKLLRETVAALSSAGLERPTPGRKTSPAFLIRGIALHDVYHTGQIQTLKALQKA